MSKKHIVTPIFSVTLGSISGFYLRDEYNNPTYLKIQEAYLLNINRRMEQPSEYILRIINVITIYYLLFYFNSQCMILAEIIICL